MGDFPKKISWNFQQNFCDEKQNILKLTIFLLQLNFLLKVFQKRNRCDFRNNE